MWDQEMAARLGTTLKRLRNEQGLSQEALAYQAGITKNQLQLIEAGKASGRRDEPASSNPRMATVVGLATVLGISASALLQAAEI
ncbi:helix-turn-helix transcriptional regulator [Microbacterium sp. 2C]|nr:helix-turn-helix transcriptional regulator [Microbacterium paulum]